MPCFWSMRFSLISHNNTFYYFCRAGHNWVPLWQDSNDDKVSDKTFGKLHRTFSRGKDKEKKKSYVILKGLQTLIWSFFLFVGVFFLFLTSVRTLKDFTRPSNCLVTFLLKIKWPDTILFLITSRKKFLLFSQWLITDHDYWPDQHSLFVTTNHWIAMFVHRDQSLITIDPNNRSILL